MASNWTKLKVGDLFDLQNGFAFKGTDFIEEGIPVIKIKNVKAGKILLNDLSYVSPAIADKAKRFLIKPNDILITMSGNRMDGSPETWVGKVAIFQEEGEYLLNQRVGILRPKVGIDINVDFCAYALSSWEYQNYFINAANSSGGQANISPAIIIDTEITLPDRVTQDEIASTLKVIDDKIRNCTELNQISEALTRTIYKEWFINFNPPIKYEIIQTTELGTFPNTWSIRKIRDIALVNQNLISKNDIFTHIEYVEISSVQRGIISDTTRYEYGTEPSRARRRLKHGDTVLSTVRPNRGAYFLAYYPEVTLIASTGFAVISPINVPFSFLYLSLTQQEKLDYYGHVADGGAYPAINPSLIMDLQIVIPDKEALELFHEVVSELFDQMSLCTKEISNLIKLKETLLPFLLKSKIEN